MDVAAAGRHGHQSRPVDLARTRRIALSREISWDPAITSTTRVSTVVYFSNEQGYSVTAYRVDHANCTLSSVQTTSTLAQLAFPATSNHRGSGVSLSRIDA